MERSQHSDKFPLGSSLPQFELANVDGRTLGSDYLKTGKLALVVFTCNHCPYVKGSERMLMAVARKFEADGLRTVTINSNDPVKYPDDGFEKMQEKANAMGLKYPYLFDETQAVARAFDAACTPEAYLFDKNMKLVFHGAINNSPKDPNGVSADFITTAITQVQAGLKLDPGFVHPIGCSIKWK